MPVVVEDTSSSSEYGSVSPDNDLNTNPFIFKPSLKCYSERDVKGTRSLFLRWDEVSHGFVLSAEMMLYQVFISVDSSSNGIFLSCDSENLYFPNLLAGAPT